MKKEKYIKGIPFREEEAGANYAEFTVTRKADASLKLKRALLITLYILFSAAFIVLFTVITKLPAVIAVLPLLLWIFWYFTWKYTQIEYSYVSYQGKLRVYRVNGYGKATEEFCGLISGALYIKPYEENDAPRNTCRDFSAGKGTEDTYIAEFQCEGNGLLLFTASSNLLRSLKYYGGSNTTVTEVSH